jgi:iron complex outermembrane receptor protein
MQYGYQHNVRQEFDLRIGSLQKIPALDLTLQTHTLEGEWEKESATQSLCLGITAMGQDNANVPGTKRIPFIPNFVNYSTGAFAVARKIVRKWTVDVGLRYDYRYYRVKGYDYKNSYYEDDLSFFNVSSTAGATIKINSSNRLDVNFSTAWRPPHVAELYSVGAHQSAAGIEYGLLLDSQTNEVRDISEANFRNEKAAKLIATYHFERKRFWVMLSGFGNYIGNYIYLKPSGITENIRGAYPYFRYDQTNVLFMGLDMSGSFDLNATIKLLSTASIIRAHNQGNTGELPFIPPNRYDAGIKWQQLSPSKFNFFLEARTKLVTQQRNGPRIITPRQFLNANKQGVDLLANDNRNFDFAQAPGSYWLLNAATGCSLKTGESQLNLRISVENGLNTTYREYTNRFRYFADDRGRNIILSIQYQL